MFETGRRSAISTSELGLYSDREDRYNRSKYGPVVRKFVIVVMAVVAVVLAAIFIYDFASGASATSKVSQETKHIYILQNALKKPSGLPKRQLASTTISPDLEIKKTSGFDIQDRSDDADPRELAYVGNPEPVEKTTESRSPRTTDERPETRSQSLENFKLRKRLLETMDTKEEETREVEGKQLFNNHAVVYRVRQRYKYPDPEEEFDEEESRPTPFHFELKTPQPASFNKHLKFPQLTQYRYPHSSRNIQDIIKYLTNDPNAPNRGIKFTGVYVNPKKYDIYPEAEEMTANSDRNEYQADGTREDGTREDGTREDGTREDDEYNDNEDDDISQSSRYATAGNNQDPFYQYKPKHPTDVNLLAPSNVRFSPSGTQRYNPYHDPFFQRPPLSYVKPIPPMPMQEIPQYVDNAAAYSNGNYGKKRKPKPFSVMLDIYPITDLNDQPSKKTSRPRFLPPPPPPPPQPPPQPPVGIEEYDPRRPMPHNRGQRYYPPSQGQSIPLVAVPASQSGLDEEEERQQMIFHLNLYPRKKNKHNRNDIIQRSGTMRPEDKKKFMHSVMSPFDAITKQLADHSAIEESKYEESDLPETGEPPDTGYQPSFFEIENENFRQSEKNYDKGPNENSPIPFNEDESSNADKLGNDEEAGDKNIYSDQECKTCQESRRIKKKWTNLSKDIDTPEGFQAFADSLLATD